MNVDPPLAVSRYMRSVQAAEANRPIFYHRIGPAVGGPVVSLEEAVDRDDEDGCSEERDEKGHGGCVEVKLAGRREVLGGKGPSYLSLDKLLVSTVVRR